MGFSLTDAIQTHVESRIERALGFASHLVRRVTARVDDVNADRGGVDKRCQIVAFVNGYGPVVAEAVEPDLYSAIDSAASRLRHAAVRLFRRRIAQSRRLSTHRQAAVALN
jgi:ribosomal subunit interface protein